MTKQTKEEKKEKKSWGYVKPKTYDDLIKEQKKLDNLKFEQEQNVKLRVQNERTKRFLAERDKRLKAKYFKEVKPKRKEQSLGQQFRQIQRQVVQQQRPVVQRQPQQFIQQPPPIQEEEGIHNFFDGNKSFTEVYGDEELTFFDSNKGDRLSRRTGSLFGI